MLLIVTNKQDLTSDYLVLRMRERNVQYLRLNTEDYGSAFHLSVRIEHGSYEGAIGFRDGRRISTKEIRGAYIRRPIEPRVPEEVIEEHRLFAERELAEMLRAFWVLVPREVWLNSPDQLRSAAIKPRQLIAAHRCGFRVPQTCISDDPAIIGSVVGKWTRPVVTKAIRSGFTEVENEFRLAATIRLPESFPADLGNYALIPATYQPEILKAYDLRVTVVDDDVFAAAIFSQESDVTRTDWRIPAGDVELRQEPVELEPDVVKACRRLTRELGLRFAAIDLVRTSDGAAVFLEANPNGEWMWIEATCGLPIRDAIIDALSRARNDPRKDSVPAHLE